MKFYRKFWRSFHNPFDALLKKAAKENKKTFLILWNRGLGDIPLGLYALVIRIKAFIPEAEITFLTRTDLSECFSMLPNVHVKVDAAMKRGTPFDMSAYGNYDVVLEKADPTRWVPWQLGKLVPKLSWNPAWDALSEKFGLEGAYVGCHVQSETHTYYGYKKDWPLQEWDKLFGSLDRILLFGFESEHTFDHPGVVDLRGKTNLFEMLSLIKNHCSHLIAPDSGVLSVLYYVDVDFPIRVVSLWADPRQGVLRQNVPSPNKELSHIPLIGKDDKVENICLDEVKEALWIPKN